MRMLGVQLLARRLHIFAICSCKQLETQCDCNSQNRPRRKMVSCKASGSVSSVNSSFWVGAQVDLESSQLLGDIFLEGWKTRGFRRIGGIPQEQPVGTPEVVRRCKWGLLLPSRNPAPSSEGEQTTHSRQLLSFVKTRLVHDSVLV